MKKYFFVILFLILLTARSYASEIAENFMGFDLLYNICNLNYNDSTGSGFGFNTYYRSSISKNFSYKIKFQFEYDNFISSHNELFYDVLNNRNITVAYNKDESFYSYSTGFLIIYTLFVNEKIFKSNSKFLKNFYMDFSSGLIYYFIYKNIKYEYNTIPTSYISTEEKSGFLPPVLGIPIIIALDFKINNKWWIDTGFYYVYLFYNDVNEIYGINNIINISLGTMYKIDFKL